MKKLFFSTMAILMVVAIFPVTILAKEVQALSSEVVIVHQSPSKESEIAIEELSEVTGSGYYILQNNITISTGEELTILEEWEVTLDLNGKTIAAELSNRPIINNGTLTLTGNGSIIGLSGVSLGSVLNNGMLTIENGDYEYSQTNGSVIRSTEKATLVINGGTFSGDRVIANFGTATFNGEIGRAHV